MNEAVLTVEDAAAHFDELVERIHANREAALIVKGGRPLARIVPLPALGEMSDDLRAFLRQWQKDRPEPDEQFASAIEESRRIAPAPRDPWE